MSVSIDPAQDRNATATATATDLGHRPGTAAYRRVVAALFVAGLATFALLYSTQAVLPALSREFGVSTAQSTLAISLTTLGLGGALLVAGPLSDALGRTALIHWSLSLSALLGLSAAIAPSWSALLCLRLLAGVALAGLPAVATAYLREELHRSAHARAAGLYIGGTALGGMSGRLLTGAVAEAAGWRWALVATGLSGVACAVVVACLLPTSRRFVPRPGRLGTVLRGAGGALAEPALLRLYGVGACASGAVVAIFNTIGFRLEAAPYGLGLGAASLVFLTYPVGTVTSTVSGRLADRFGRRAVLPVGCAVAIGGVLLTLAGPLPVMVGGVALLAGGFFAVHGVASGWVPSRAHAAGVSTAQAASLYLFSFYLGSSVFGSAAGAAWTGVGWSGVVALAVCLLLGVGLLALRLRRIPVLSVDPPRRPAPG